MVLEPDGPAMLGAMLRWANNERLAVVPRGSGTKLTWGALPTRFDVLLSTTRLVTGLEHNAGDLTATIPAGMRLATANATLASARQWLPLDPFYEERATIGGLLATNDSGPRRQQHGTPRDLVLGVEMVLADGRVAKAGGKVVKNVAGYDLARVLCGSYGTLAVITAATFKLAPLPQASVTLTAQFAHYEALSDAAMDISSASLAPSAVEFEVPRLRLLVRFESTAASAERQAALAAGLCERHGAATAVLEGEAETTHWRDYRSSGSPQAILVKITVLPSRLVDILEDVDGLCARHGVTWRMHGRAALGVLLLTMSGDAESVAAAIVDSRAAAQASGGAAVMLSGDPATKSRIDPWGPVGDALTVIREVKNRFDPNGTLNPGRGPGGV
jgi:glycolate oxidase FAD binding subunit